MERLWVFVKKFPLFERTVSIQSKRSFVSIDPEQFTTTTHFLFGMFLWGTFSNNKIE
jgi:hypothetical protein